MTQNACAEITEANDEINTYIPTLERKENREIREHTPNFYVY